MLNSRVIVITSKNVDSGKVSLQQSDIQDYLSGQMRYLLVVEKGQSLNTAEVYSDEKLDQLMGRAIANGRIVHKDTGSIFYLAERN